VRDVPNRRHSTPGSPAGLPIVTGGKRRALLIFALACTAGCDGASTEAGRHLVADSAGVRIVTNQGPRWAPGGGWRVDTMPIVAVGADEGDSLAMLQVVAGAMRTADGVLVVADRGSSQLKYFDRAGRLLQVVGRKGRGPGEFEYIAWLLPCGSDSAFVSDIGNRTVSVVAPPPQAGVVRTFSIRTSEASGTPFSAACSRQGSLLTTGWGDVRRAMASDRPVRPEVPVDQSRADGTWRRAVGLFPGTEMARVTGGASPRIGGRWLRVAQGRRLSWVAPNDGRGLLAFDSLGALALIVRGVGEESPLSADDRQWLARLQLDSLQNPRQRARIERELALHPFPDRLPAHFALLVDADDHGWVQGHPRVAEPDPAWEVVTPEGIWLGSVRLPPGARPLEIGSDYVLAVRTAESGAEEVVEFRLGRRARAGGS
jgi:hypothetical protein